MIVTTQILKKFQVEPSIIEIFNNNYPDGLELSEIICNKNSTLENLHYLRRYLSFNQEELDLYCKRCNIINSKDIWESDKVKSSQYIVKSSDVIESCGVFNSKDVKNSNNIVNAENIEEGQNIFISSIIESSEKIFNCKNVISSINVCNSTMIIGCKNVTDSFNIFNSSEIIKSVGVQNSHFIQNCKNVKFCLFCNNLNDAEYCVFNVQVDKDLYQIFEKQYNKYMEALLNFVQDWPEHLLTEFIPKTNKINCWYTSISEKFWKWVRTLPNFDSMLIYDITMLPEILID